MQKFNQFRLVNILLLSSISVFIGACSSSGEKRPDYMDANTVEALQIPPKLSSPDTSDALLLPEPAAQKDCQ